MILFRHSALNESFSSIKLQLSRRKTVFFVSHVTKVQYFMCIISIVSLSSSWKTWWATSVSGWRTMTPHANIIFIIVMRSKWQILSVRLCAHGTLPNQQHTLHIWNFRACYSCRSTNETHANVSNCLIFISKTSQLWLCAFVQRIPQNISKVSMNRWHICLIPEWKESQQILPNTDYHETELISSVVCFHIYDFICKNDSILCFLILSLFIFKLNTYIFILFFQ